VKSPETSAMPFFPKLAQGAGQSFLRIAEILNDTTADFAITSGKVNN
jgi:hypothetical protein